MSWSDLPQGHYAVAMHETDADWCADPIGYQVIRKGRSYRSGWGRVTVLGKAGLDKLTFLELVEVVEKDPDWYREEFGRFAGKCGVCGRTLTDPESKARGIGPDCVKAWR